MKYSVTALSLLIFTIIAVPVFSQSPTSTPSGSLTEEVDKLKEKVAEKVEQLKETDKAVAGIVAELDKNEWTLTDADGKKVSISIDDTLTDFFDIAGTKTTDLKQDDIEKGDYVFVTGPEIGDSITANAVYRDQQYMVISGKITNVTSEDFTIHVLTVDKTDYILDIESKTSQKMLNIKTLETEKIGFSKLKEGDSVHVVVKGNPENTSQSRYTAQRLLVIPNEYFLQ